jgi:hypothetical protein
MITAAVYSLGQSLSRRDIGPTTDQKITLLLWNLKIHRRPPSEPSAETYPETN